MTNTWDKDISTNEYNNNLERIKNINYKTIKIERSIYEL